jgi:molybdopterin molybdotransferase
MLDLESARAQLLDHLTPLPPESICIQHALHRIAAESIQAPIPLPPFDNSAMDGYALRSGDTTQATTEKPIPVKSIGHVAAGSVFHGTIASGECVRIFTGSMLPAGADAVIMQEDVLLDPKSPGIILIPERVTPWESVRFQGEDVKLGASLVQTGEEIQLGALALLSACGLGGVKVSRRPRVMILTTGTELQPAGQTLGPGQIHESNSLVLGALVQRAGGEVCLQEHVPDDPRQTAEALKRGFDVADVVLTAGGASVGEHDYVRSAFQSLGGEIEFWKIAMKPGKPFFCGRLGNKTLLGVPGNPVSALVTSLVLVYPALRRLQGARECLPPWSQAQLGEPLANPDGRRHFMRVRLDDKGLLRSSGVQASHVLSSLASSCGVVDVPPRHTFEPGDWVRYLRLD